MYAKHNHIKPISENDNMLEGFKNFIGYTATRSSGRILHRNVWNRRIVNPNAQNAVLQMHLIITLLVTIY